MLIYYAEGLVVELAHFHVQSVWRSNRERFQVTRLTTCCNYL